MILDLLFPKKCLECKKPGKYICSNCLKKVRPGIKNSSNYSIFKYEGVIRKAIINLKYKYATDIAEELVKICVYKLKNKKKFKNVTLVPIPLHWKRENERGFNQVEIIGRKVAKELNWKFEPNLLIRNKSTIPQVQLKGEERRKNLTGVFKINENNNLDNNSLIFLFDDVYTTGSTINEAGKVLLKDENRNIKGLTIAR